MGKKCDTETKQEYKKKTTVLLLACVCVYIMLSLSAEAKPLSQMGKSLKGAEYICLEAIRGKSKENCGPRRMNNALRASNKSTVRSHDTCAHIHEGVLFRMRSIKSIHACQY